jgi:tetratricopeptide (TPR) repeat protein
MLKEIGNKNEILQFIEEYKLANLNSEDLKIEIAKFLMENEKYDDSIVWFDLVIKKNPLNEFAQNSKLEALMKLNQPKKALDTLQMLLAIHPDNKELLLKKIKIYDQLQKYDQCISTIDKLLKLSPTDEDLLRSKIRYLEVLDQEGRALETQQKLWMIGVRQVEDFLREKLLQGTLKKEHVDHIYELRQKYDINEQVYQEILNRTSGLKTLRPSSNEFMNNHGKKVSEILEKKAQVQLMRDKITDLKTKTDNSEEMYQKMVNRISRLRTLDTENGNGNGHSGNGVSKDDKDSEEFDIEKKLGIQLKSPSKKSNGKLKVKSPPKSAADIANESNPNGDAFKNGDNPGNSNGNSISNGNGLSNGDLEKKKNSLEEIKKLLEEI